MNNIKIKKTPPSKSNNEIPNDDPDEPDENPDIIIRSCIPIEKTDKVAEKSRKVGKKSRKVKKVKKIHSPFLAFLDRDHIDMGVREMTNVRVGKVRRDKAKSLRVWDLAWVRAWEEWGVGKSKSKEKRGKEERPKNSKEKSEREGGEFKLGEYDNGGQNSKNDSSEESVEAGSVVSCFSQSKGTSSRYNTVLCCV